MTIADRMRALQAQADQNVCAVCASDLTAAANPDGSGPALRCPKCGYHPDTRPKVHSTLLTRFVRKEQLTQLELMNLSQSLRNTIRWREAAGNREVSARSLTRLLLAVEQAQGGSVTQQQLQPYEEQQMTRARAADSVARFIDLGKTQNPEALRAQIIDIVVRTGLRPELGEVIVYEGKPYITADGFRHLLNRDGDLDGIDAPHYLSLAEKLERGYREDDLVCELSVWRTGRNRPVVGIGRASATHPHRGKQPVEVAETQRMAETRALRHAARLGFQDLLSRYRVDMIPDDAEEQERSGRIPPQNRRPAARATAAPPPPSPATTQSAPATQQRPSPAPGSPNGSATATPGQIKAITGMAQKYWQPGELAGHCLELYGTSAVNQLTVAQASELYNHLAGQKPPTLAQAPDDAALEGDYQWTDQAEGDDDDEEGGEDHDDDDDDGRLYRSSSGGNGAGGSQAQ